MTSNRTTARTRAAIVEAAIRELERLGVTATTMADVAAAAAVSRMTLYRHFADRSALFEAILTARYAIMLGQLQQRLAGYEIIDEALIEGGSFALWLADEDRMVREIVTHATDRNLERFLLNNTPELRAMHFAAWQPAFTRARLAGGLREDLPDARLIDGLRSVLNLLLLREDLDEPGRRAFIRDFIVPAVTGRTNSLPVSS